MQIGDTIYVVYSSEAVIEGVLDAPPYKSNKTSHWRGAEICRVRRKRKYRTTTGDDIYDLKRPPGWKTLGVDDIGSEIFATKTSKVFPDRASALKALEIEVSKTLKDKRDWLKIARDNVEAAKKSLEWSRKCYRNLKTFDLESSFLEQTNGD